MQPTKPTHTHTHTHTHTLVCVWCVGCGFGNAGVPGGSEEDVGGWADPGGPARPVTAPQLQRPSSSWAPGGGWQSPGPVVSGFLPSGSPPAGTFPPTGWGRGMKPQGGEQSSLGTWPPLEKHLSISCRPGMGRDALRSPLQDSPGFGFEAGALWGSGQG